MRTILDFEQSLKDVADSEDFLESQLESSFAQKAGLPTDWRAIVEKLIQDSIEIDIIRYVYLCGFDGILAGNITRQASNDLNKDVANWVHNPQKRAKSFRFLISLDAVFVAAYLERFMDEAASLLSLSSSDNISNLWRAEREQDETLERFLQRILCPSARRSGKKWREKLKRVLNQDCDETVAKAIIVLIAWRNKFVHSTQGLDHYIMNVDGSTLKSWKLAVYIFGVWFAKAATDQDSPTRSE